MNRYMVAMSLAVLGLIGAASLYFGKSSDTGEAGQESAGTSQTSARRILDPLSSKDAFGTDFEGSKELPFTVSGMVVMPDKTAVKGAVVTIEFDKEDNPQIRRELPYASSDGSGHFELSSVLRGSQAIDAGSFRLIASHPQFAPAQRRFVDLAAANAANIVLELGAAQATLSGMVSDQSGGPVAGVMVALRKRTKKESKLFTYAALTNQAGRYQIALAPGEYTLRATHPEYVASAKRLEMSAAPRSLDVILSPGAFVEGQVRSSVNGEGIADVSIYAAAQRLLGSGRRGQYRRNSGRGMQFSARTGGEGQFRIGPLPSGVITLWAKGKGMISQDTTELAIGIAETISEVLVFLNPSHTVEGRVVKAGTEEGIEKVEVRAVQQGALIARSSPSKKDGSFRISGLPAGSLRLTADVEGYLETSMMGTVIHIDDRDLENVRVELTPGMFIEGRVDPPMRSTISLALNQDAIAGIDGESIFQALGAATVSDEDGSFRFGPVSVGNFVLKAQATGKDPLVGGFYGQKTVNVTTPKTQDVVIPLEPALSLSGVVVSASGTPVPSATVSIKEESDGGTELTVIVNGNERSAQRTIADAEGKFLLSGIAPGDYSIRVSDSSGRPLSFVNNAGRARLEAFSLSVKKSKKNLSLRVENRDGVISGSVRNTAGNAVPDAWVSAYFSPLPREKKKGQSRSMFVVEDSEEQGDLDLYGLLKSERPVLTNEHGAFVIQGLRQGIYTIVAEAQKGGSRAWVEDAAIGSTHTLVLKNLGGIKGRVSKAGEPVNEFVVTLEGSTRHSQRIRSDDGGFDLERVDPGRYELTIDSLKGQARTEVEILPGETLPVELRIEGGGIVKGRLVDGSGAGVAGARVAVGQASPGGGGVMLEMDGNNMPPPTPSSGQFSKQLAVGKHILVVMHPSKPQPFAVLKITVSAGETLDLGDIKEGQGMDQEQEQASPAQGPQEQ